MAGPYSDSRKPTAAARTSTPTVLARLTGAPPWGSPDPSRPTGAPPWGSPDPSGSPVRVPAGGEPGGGLLLAAGDLGEEVEDQLELLVRVAGVQLLEGAEPLGEQRGHAGVDALGVD